MRALFTWMRSSIGYIWLVIVAGYFAVSAGQAVIRNYSSQQETARLEQEVAGLMQERKRLEALVVYYQTDTYREKELRRALLLKRPGETVYALPESSAGLTQETEEASEAKEQRQQDTWRQWVDYLFAGKAG